MFTPDWLGKIDWKKGLYLSKKSNFEEYYKEKTTLETNQMKLEIIKKLNEGMNDNNTNETKFNYNKQLNLDIPYYNETIDYMNSKTNIKYDTNYYHLLDRIGSISKFLLKGNDYYKLYISKNANKYYNDHEVDTSTNNNNSNDTNDNTNDPNTSNDTKTQYTKLALNIKYQLIEKSIIDDSHFDE